MKEFGAFPGLLADLSVVIPADLRKVAHSKVFTASIQGWKVCFADVWSIEEGLHDEDIILPESKSFW